MKVRRVVLQLEVETDVPIKDLRRAGVYAVSIALLKGGQPKFLKVIQAQANVITKEK